MKKIYAIIICIYALSAVQTVFNDPYADGSGGLFDTTTNEMGVGFDVVDPSGDKIATVTELN